MGDWEEDPIPPLEARVEGRIPAPPQPLERAPLPPTQVGSWRVERGGVSREGTASPLPERPSGGWDLGLGGGGDESRAPYICRLVGGPIEGGFQEDRRILEGIVGL